MLKDPGALDRSPPDPGRQTVALTNPDSREVVLQVQTQLAQAGIPILASILSLLVCLTLMLPIIPASAPTVHMVMKSTDVEAVAQDPQLVNINLDCLLESTTTAIVPITITMKTATAQVITNMKDMAKLLVITITIDTTMHHIAISPETRLMKIIVVQLIITKTIIVQVITITAIQAHGLPLLICIDVTVQPVTLEILTVQHVHITIVSTRIGLSPMKTTGTTMWTPIKKLIGIIMEITTIQATITMEGTEVLAIVIIIIMGTTTVQVTITMETTIAQVTITMETITVQVTITMETTIAQVTITMETTIAQVTITMETITTTTVQATIMTQSTTVQATIIMKTTTVQATIMTQSTTVQAIILMLTIIIWVTTIMVATTAQVIIITKTTTVQAIIIIIVIIIKTTTVQAIIMTQASTIQTTIIMELSTVQTIISTLNTLTVLTTATLQVIILIIKSTTVQTTMNMETITVQAITTRFITVKARIMGTSII
ncbi:uncharacterized protein LOC106963462 isoform X8 [Poecilia latipinna]|uniref:uncharacterized protein LOC106963462 isoform X8 n=1 Tax=Poecilia latipinna TaxID=48699 RepID=UPI00072ED3FE|nr:PREDICTED: uncharacterized protein LOC106963462 isoform X8 [Poecilia latipinna]